MKYLRSQKYPTDYLQEYMMGPNAMKLLEELLTLQPLPPGATVLDLGCGHGLTSVFMAKEFGLHVFATDLWIDATENKEHFDALGLSSQQIIPIHAEAHDLPYANEFFDAAVSVDSYHYYGRDEEYLGKHLLPLVRCGGYLLIAVPGMRDEFHGSIPPELLSFWTAEDLETIRDTIFWRELISKTKGAELISIGEMQGFDECWNDWLLCDNDYARNDRRAFEAGMGRYMNFIAIVLKRV